MDGYAATGSQTVTASPGDTALAVESSANTRGRVHYVSCSASGTLSDLMMQWLLRRFTAVGTRTTLTPEPLDIDAPAAKLGGAENHTAEPTYTASSELLDQDYHLRATMQLHLVDGKEFMVPATANNGIGITPISASYSGDVRSTMHWRE